MTAALTCLVIPCFNEERRHRPTEVVDFLEVFPDVHLCLVDDGGRDETYALVSGLAASHPDRVSALCRDRNRAKAARTGMLHGLGNTDHERLGYWDADLATPLGGARSLQSRDEADPGPGYPHGPPSPAARNDDPAQQDAPLPGPGVRHPGLPAPQPPGLRRPVRGHAAALDRIREVPLDRWTDAGGSELSPAACRKALRDIFIISRAHDTRRCSDSK